MRLKANMKVQEGVSLIIPIFNEEKTLENVISRCSKQKEVKQIVVVNDGSTDNTKKILNKLKSKLSKISIVNHPRNLGKGAAIKSGLRKAVGKYVMVQDADLEYSPEEIINLFEKAEKSPDGIVFGTRSHQKKKGYLLAQLGNWYLNILFNFLFNLNLTDSYTCYKLIPKKIWQKIHLESDGFEIDSELVSKLGLNKCNILEIPISYQPRKYSEGKKINWLDIIKATAVAFKVRLKNPKVDTLL